MTDDAEHTSYLAPVLRNVGITDPLTITGINAGLAAWNMVSSLTLGAFSEEMGRRPMWIIRWVDGLCARIAKTRPVTPGWGSHSALFSDSPLPLIRLVAPAME